MEYRELQSPKDWVGAWILVGAMFLALVVGCVVVDMLPTGAGLKSGAPAANAVGRKAPPARRAETCCGPYDQPRPTSR